MNCLHSKGVCVTDANKILFQVNDITTFMKEIKHLSDVTKRGNLHKFFILIAIVLMLKG